MNEFTGDIDSGAAPEPDSEEAEENRGPSEGSVHYDLQS